MGCPSSKSAANPVEGSEVSAAQDFGVQRTASLGVQHTASVKMFSGKPRVDRCETKFSDLLGRECMAVVKDSYFEHCLTKGRPFQDRADIPERFLFSGVEALQEWERHGAKFLIVFSYSRLAKQHPDPDMYHLKRIVPVLKAFKTFLQQHYDDSPAQLGIIIDFCSIWQNRDEEPLTRRQLSQFKEALAEINTPFGHQDVTAIRLTGVPSDVISTYVDQGWTLFESAIIDGKAPSSDLKDSNCKDTASATEKLGTLNVLSVPQDFEPADKDLRVRPMSVFMHKFAGARRPPLTPKAFSVLMKERQERAIKRNVPLFANGRDQPFLLQKYSMAYDDLIQAESATLEHLKWTAEEWGDYAQVLGSCKSLKELSLRQSRPDDLQDDHIDKESGAVQAGLPQVFMDKLAPAFSALSLLEVLDMAMDNIDDAAALQLARALQHTPKLKKLCLGSNAIGPVGMKHLRKTFLSLRAMESLNLMHNPLGDEGVALLVEIMPKMLQLQELRLDDTGCGNEAILKLCAVLPSGSSLKCIMLSSNDEITDAAALDLADLRIRCPDLHMELAGTGLSQNAQYQIFNAKDLRVDLLRAHRSKSDMLGMQKSTSLRMQKSTSDMFRMRSLSSLK